MNFLDETFFDSLYRYIADCMNEKLQNAETNYAEKLEKQILQETIPDKKAHLIEYIDVCRRVQMRTTGKSYVAGFIMGICAGTSLNNDE